MEYIFVTNHNDELHVDLHDGIEYAFPPKEKVAVPVDAAVHMLGFNLRDKTDVLVRLGWAMTYDPDKRRFVENPEGIRRLARFQFTKTVMVEADADGEALV